MIKLRENVPEAPSGIANDRATASDFQGSNLDRHQAGLRALNTIAFWVKNLEIAIYYLSSGKQRR